MSHNRIDQKFAELRARGKKAFIAYVTAGYPSLEATEELVLSMAGNGADIIELGVPFSDPMADGLTIQAASFKALKGGTTPAGILDVVRRVRKVSQVPITLMSYYNPVFHYGDEKFAAAAKLAGVDGLIIPDLPVEEAGSLRAAARKHDLSLVFFLAPTTSPARAAGIVRAAGGFLYFVSVAGVTGARVSAPVNIAGVIRRIKAMTDVPVCVGFGIATPEQVNAVAAYSDGVIVGSAIIKVIDANITAADMPARVGSFVKQLSCGL
jgi:tryptophan synthase alpha chain